MKIKLSGFIICLFCFFSSCRSADVWVPIRLGDITFFVPFSAQIDIPPTVPELNIPDANLLSCIQQAMYQLGTDDYTKIITLYCAGQNIVNLDGIEALVNLEKLSLGNNYISDVTPITKLPNLWWLHLASYKFTNEIYNAELAKLSNMPNLKDLTVNATRNEKIDFYESNFSEGFPGITIDNDKKFTGGSSLAFIVEVLPGNYSGMSCELMGALDDKYPYTVYLPEGVWCQVSW